MVSKVNKPIILYKDFNKDVKDLLTKSYSEPEKWKVESKFKGPKDRVFINPTATSDGKFSADVEYALSQCGASFKANVTPKGDAKLTVGYSEWGHKAEVVVNQKGEFEFNHECTIQNRISSHEKILKDAVEVGVLIPVAPNCAIGTGAVCKLQGKKECNWSAGCRFSDGKHFVAVRTDKLQTYTTSVLSRVPTCPHRVLVAAEFVCGRDKGWNGTLGLEADCLVMKGNTIKARVNKNKEWAVAYVAKIAGGWTAAVSVDKNLKAGVLLSHS